MTTSLEKAIRETNGLPAAKWDRQFAESQDVLEALAEEALAEEGIAEYEAGRTRKLAAR